MRKFAIGYSLMTIAMFSVLASPTLVFFAACFTTLALILLNYFSLSRNKKTIPPGTFGWPILGETLEFFQFYHDGESEKFFKKRVDKYQSQVFKTSLFGEHAVVFCGPEGSKFLFGNENKLVQVWWPNSIKKLFGACLVNLVGDDAKRLKKMLMTFFGREALLHYTSNADMFTQQHLKTHWQGKEEVKVYPATKFYTFKLVCRLFMGLEDPIQISELATQFYILLKGVVQLSINFPGTRFYSSMKAARAIRKQLNWIISARKIALEEGMASPSQDLLSHLLVSADENGKFLSDNEIINNILMLLFAGHDNSTATITMLMKHLAELPEVYEAVLREQMEIAASKEEGELLKWEDMQRMKYSWSVVSEVLRHTPPVVGGFRQAIVDFDYAGYTIPKGWKIYWSAAFTQKEEALFPNSTNFDVSRFEGTGPTPFTNVPFGGGHRMCLGKEFFRMVIFVFLHNVVKKFKWELLIPGEKFEYDPIPTPVEGLPIGLQPRQS